MTTYSLKQGDTGAPFTAKLADQDGALTITSNDAVVLSGRNQRTGIAKFTDIPAVIDDVATAAVSVDLISHPTVNDVPGVYEIEWKVEYQGGNGEQRVPNAGYDLLCVWEKIS